ncbi:MAG: aliphatic sulfonate ABC transporter substrate-binding protein, partial [Kamptonema sp. SIO4C4]|nr:aliphatic sulfonate ABC transporter substrate-binding protein [Kamptonema sp. SIO4C4]
MSKFYRKILNFILIALLGFSVITLPSCVTSQVEPLEAIRLDYATYNLVSLVLKEKGWMEQEFAPDNIQVQWALSLGSNKAIQLLNSTVVDFASTSGGSSLIARTNDSPIQGIYIYSNPEWNALVTTANSPITQVSDLRGKTVAAAPGTDAYIFLVRSLNEFGLTTEDVTVMQMQHNQGKAALEQGEVDAWAGLDPYMAETEIKQNSRLFFRNSEFCTYGMLNVREDFARRYPEYIERVLKVYEKGRLWSMEHPDELREILARGARLQDAIAAKQIERTDLSNPRLTEDVQGTLKAAGEVSKAAGIISEKSNLDQATNLLIE